MPYHTRVGDRSVNSSLNEADSRPAAQPCLLSSSAEQTPSPKPNGVWIVALPALALLIAVVAVQTAPVIHQAPPPLQTFAKPRINHPAIPPKTARQGKKATEPIIRVNVTSDGVNSLQLEVRGRYRMISLDTQGELAKETGLSRIVVTSTSKGLKLGSQQYATRQIEIQPDQSPSIRVDNHLYRGRIRLFRRPDGLISVVNVLPIEEYLASVVDSEMPTKFPDAARKAQAIVARTYALYQVRHADPNSLFDLFASQRSQKYLGVEYVDASGRRLAGESESSRRVVKETRGVICTLRNELFCTYYSAVCGGRTINGHEVFKDATDALQSVPCEFCRESPHYRWTTELSRDVFQQRAANPNSSGKKALAIRSVRQTSTPGTGVISQFELDTGKERPSVSGIELRDRMPSGTLHSPHFQIKLEMDRVVFDGRGHGHGVGFCQWGAKGQAEAGRTSAEIIRHYFSGIELTDLGY
jgi:stage II sporulation protein D